MSLLIKESPTLIITSPFNRTKETAEPTLKIFPNIKHETWDVQEFTHLEIEKYKGTFYEIKKEQRKYWEQSDPDYVDGEGAESFNMLLSRARGIIDRLDRLPNGFIVIVHPRPIHPCHASFKRKSKPEPKATF